MTERNERVSASVDEEFKQQLRVEAAKRGVSMSELIREILAENLEGDSGNGDPAMATTAD